VILSAAMRAPLHPGARPPDPLQEQAAQHLQVTAAPLKVVGQLDFTLRRRRCRALRPASIGP
jgi:hypothetical protein